MHVLCERRPEHPRKDRLKGDALSLFGAHRKVPLAWRCHPYGHLLHARQNQFLFFSAALSGLCVCFPVCQSMPVWCACWGGRGTRREITGSNEQQRRRKRGPATRTGTTIQSCRVSCSKFRFALADPEGIAQAYPKCRAEMRSGRQRERSSHNWSPATGGSSGLVHTPTPSHFPAIVREGGGRGGGGAGSGRVGGPSGWGGGLPDPNIYGLK